MGTSTKPVLAILPESANTFVPADFAVPTELNAEAPLAIIQPTLA